jgi:hypothetical protein
LSMTALASRPSNRGGDMAGSLRKRGRDSWQLRIYRGGDPETAANDG